MEIRATGTAADAADLAATAIAERLHAAVAARGTATLALSGGRTPALMVQRLAESDVAWPHVHLFQVDERAVAVDDPDRNWTTFAPLVTLLPDGHAHAVPVGAADDDAALLAAADEYARTLARVSGNPVVLDVVHLGLGNDGHTASLPPGDPVVEVTDRDVAVTASYRGHRRLTLTRPVLDRARAVVWLVVGPDKADVARRLLACDPALVGSHVGRDRALVVLDAAAAALTGRTG
jgi:6-phosphogluconolactonase